VQTLCNSICRAGVCYLKKAPYVPPLNQMPTARDGVISRSGSKPQTESQTVLKIMRRARSQRRRAYNRVIAERDNHVSRINSKRKMAVGIELNHGTDVKSKLVETLAGERRCVIWRRLRKIGHETRSCLKEDSCNLVTNPDLGSCKTLRRERIAFVI